MANQHYKHMDKMLTCAVCGQEKSARQMLPAATVRPVLSEIIAKDVPHWNGDSHICLSCLNRFRTDYVRQEMEKDRGELDTLEQEVLKSIDDNATIADNINEEFDKNLTVGEHVADKVAEFGGSWSFIGIFFSVMAIWIVINSVTLFLKPFDPYPYILFNLVLSMLAAIQAPIIMMSQNRQEARDRLRAENDFQVNLKAELEIRTLHEKMDQLLHNQWMRLIEIQQIQMEMLEDLASKRGK